MKRTVTKNQWGTMIVEPIERPAPIAKQKALTVPTAERHLQIIARWEKQGIVTAAKAKKLRADVVAGLR
jgi:hypothetical protein